MNDETAKGDAEDCTVVSCGKCGRAVILCVTKRIDRESRTEIGKAIAGGCSAAHMTAAEARRVAFGCECNKGRNLELSI